MKTSARDYTRATFGEPFPLKSNRRGRHTFIVEGVDHEGETFQIKRTRPTSSEAQDALRDAIVRARDGLTRTPVAERVTMRALYERWWDHEAAIAADPRTTSRVLSDSSRIKYRDTWHRHLEPALGDRLAETITHAEVYDLLHAPRSAAPKPLLDTLRSLFRYAEIAGIVTPGANPTKGSFGISKPKPAPEPIDASVLGVIEDHLAALKPAGVRKDVLRLHDSFVLMRATGMRVSEVLAVRVRDFDPVRRTVKVNARVARSLRDDGAAGTQTKVLDGSKTLAGVRTLTIDERAARILIERAKGRAPEDFFFPTSTGRAMATESWRNALAIEVAHINRARAAADLPLIPTIHPHQLRVTVATQLVGDLVQRYGLAAGLESARKQLGHKSIATLTHYVTEEVQAEDNSAILSGLDPVLARRRAAEAAVQKIEADDPQLNFALEVVSSERSVHVVSTIPLSEAQRAAITAVLDPLGIRLLS